MCDGAPLPRSASFLHSNVFFSYRFTLVSLGSKLLCRQSPLLRDSHSVSLEGNLVPMHDAGLMQSSASRPQNLGRQARHSVNHSRLPPERSICSILQVALPGQRSIWRYPASYNSSATSIEPRHSSTNSSPTSFAGASTKTGFQTYKARI